MQLIYTDGRKSITLADFDNFIEKAMDGAGEGGAGDLSRAMDKVAFVYRSTHIIADAVKDAPWKYYQAGTEDEYEGDVDFLPDLERTMALLSLSLLAPGNAYLFKVQARRDLLDLKYMVAGTIKPHITQAGLVSFERRAGGKTRIYPADKFVYFWPPDEGVELGEATRSPVIAALQAADATYEAAKFIADFFARGAIRGTLLTTEGMPNKDERKRLKDWWNRTFGKGNETSFSTEIVQAKAVTPVQVGDGLEALNNSELTKEQRENIVVALGVPMSLLLSSTIAGMGGGGVASQDEINFYSKTVRPLANFIAKQLNTQVLETYGIELRAAWNTMDVFQEDERKRAISTATYVQMGFKPAVAAYMNGLEVPRLEDVPPHFWDAFIEPDLEPVAEDEPEADGEKDHVAEAQQAAESAERAELKKAVTDLDRWERKAIKRYGEGKPLKALAFDSVEIPKTRQAAILGALSECVTVDEVKSVFDNARLWQEYP